MWNIFQNAIFSSLCSVEVLVIKMITEETKILVTDLKTIAVTSFLRLDLLL